MPKNNIKIKNKNKSRTILYWQIVNLIKKYDESDILNLKVVHDEEISSYVYDSPSQVPTSNTDEYSSTILMDFRIFIPQQPSRL